MNIERGQVWVYRDNPNRHVVVLEADRGVMFADGLARGMCPKRWFRQNFALVTPWRTPAMHEYQ